MVKQLTFILLLIVSTKIFSQEKQIVISGNIISDALSVENIHILNKTSNKGTITNKYGEFKIPVKTNDTLVFSGIQFYKKEILITQQLIKNKSIIIKLFQKTNELDEVEVKTHNLTGNLATDINNVKDSVSKISPLSLDYSMIETSNYASTAKHIKDPTDISQQVDPNIPVSGDVKAVLRLIFKPLFKKVSKIGKNRRQRKNEEKIYLKNVVDAPEKMIAELGEAFFSEALKIPSNKIIPFINHCKSKGIIDLYIKQRKIEAINLLIIESKVYLKKIRNEK